MAGTKAFLSSEDNASIVVAPIVSTSNLYLTSSFIRCLFFYLSIFVFTQDYLHYQEFIDLMAF